MNRKPPFVAGIIPTYGQFNYARTAVLSFLTYTEDSVAIVVDDGSPDWNEHWLEGIRREQLVIQHFESNVGLTRSWNWGIEIAHELGARQTVVTNSDVVFTREWYKPVAHALDHGWSLVGPLTNAPGHLPQQSITQYVSGYRVN